MPGSFVVRDATRLCIEVQALRKGLISLAKEVETLIRADKLGVEQRNFVSAWLLDTKPLLQEDYVAQRKSISLKDLQARKDALLEAVHLEDQTAEAATLDPSTTELWFAGKVMDRSKQLLDYTAGSEKSRITVKLKEEGDIRPYREPQLDAEAEKAMMAWQFRRQEQQKILSADDEECSTSPWANTGLLKRDLSGVQAIKLA